MARIRRAPNFVAFISTGVIVGFVVGSVVAYLDGPTPNYSMAATVGFIGLLGACVFGMLAAIVAVLLDRRR